MYMTLSKQSGFTLLELLLVISIAVVIMGISFAGFQNYASFQQYNQAVGDAQFTIKQARSNALLAANDMAHGVKILPDSIIYFAGDTYVAGAPSNEVTTYTLVTFQPTLTDGVDEIVFAKLTGLPSATGTILISGSDYPETTTLSISKSGVIQ